MLRFPLGMETRDTGWFSDGLWPLGPSGITQGSMGTCVAEESACTSFFEWGPELALHICFVLMMFQCPLKTGALGSGLADPP